MVNTDLMNKNKTLEEHKYYLNEIVKLSLWVVADYYTKNNLNDSQDLIDIKTPLYYHTTFNKHHIFDDSKLKPKEWDDMKEKLHNLLLENSDTSVFEKKGYELLEPYIEGRAERDMYDLHVVEPATVKVEKGWVIYDLNESNGGTLELHMENSLYPNSFMSDKEHFYKMLKIAVVEAKRSGYKKLSSHTWLNQYEKFLNLMPTKWRESQSDIHYDIHFHFGFWGQFLRANETFNERTAAYLREKGEIKYPTTYCEATIEDFERLLESIS